jgi:hypothetical protein
MLASFTALTLVAASAAAQTAAPPAPASGHGKADFLRTYDTDLDGAVSRAEFDAQRGRDYARTDANGDGALTETEYVGDYTTRLDAELAEMRRRQLEQAHVRFGVLDSDHSDRMSRAEFDASGARSFSRLDSNGDGRIDDQDAADHF